ncbi:hypothetical protein ABI309_02415 [Citrobacter youngae]|uniref:hypothetical protein n=1 Tax=Citrobacter TaxID=544 RepID=UPI001E4B2F07|nr:MULTISPECIES: hypothetical protein [Citrobacter]MDM3241869.1 hypothetical protein [Citrobacter sp. Cf081]GJK71407.1 hypothetical protein TUM17564_34340 [Citrobacter freundii]
MRHFKLIVLVTSAILAGSASASDITTLTKSLKPWQPVEITKSKDAVTVVIDDKQITDTIYDAVINAGVCPNIWTKDVPAKYLESIKELRIVNKHKAQGYVFENPLNSCNEMGKETPEKAKTIMLSNTHLFRN